MNDLNRDDKQVDLLARLVEDSSSAEDARALLPLIVRLRDTDIGSDPAKLRAATQSAITVLRRGQKQNPVPIPSYPGEQYRVQASYLFALGRSQLRIVRSELWIASILVMVLGIAVTLFSVQPGAASGGELPFVLIAPAVAAVGVAFLYGPDAEAMVEMEQATPTPPYILLLLRLTFVFVFDFSLGLMGSVAMTLVNPMLSLSPLIASWLAPMSFLSALAFLLSIVFADATAGIVISLLLWTAQVLNRFSVRSGLAPIVPLPDLLSSDLRLWMVLLAVPLFGVALWLAGRDISLSRRLHP